METTILPFFQFLCAVNGIQLSCSSEVSLHDPVSSLYVGPLLSLLVTHTLTTSVAKLVMHIVTPYNLLFTMQLHVHAHACVCMVCMLCGHWLTCTRMPPSFLIAIKSCLCKDTPHAHACVSTDWQVGMSPSLLIVIRSCAMQVHCVFVLFCGH